MLSLVAMFARVPCISLKVPGSFPVPPSMDPGRLPQSTLYGAEIDMSAPCLCEVCDGMYLEKEPEEVNETGLP
jgi:hypothetical protein